MKSYGKLDQQCAIMFNIVPGLVPGGDKAAFISKLSNKASIAL